MTGEQVVAIEPNTEDKFSVGHICAKGLALEELNQDPDRIREPLIRDGEGFRTASWDEAFELINEQLNGVVRQHGSGAVATYIGNPTAHNIGLSMGLGVYLGALGSPQVYSAGSVDQLPKQLASELMFGNGMAIPVPDIGRCDYLLMLGANPIVSNGSLWMVPNFRDKCRAMKDRGGRFVTVDPRRTETARLADEHLYIRPGTDAWLLAALINQLRHKGIEIPKRFDVENQDSLFSALDNISLESGARMTGIPAVVIVRLADDLSKAQKPVVYGRVGTTLQKHGTLTSFLIEVLNIMTGSLDEVGGAMFPEQAFSLPSTGWQGESYRRYSTRVSGYPEVLGQYPAAALAEEIETPGKGQIRALVCFAGNPVVSNPDSERLARALDVLDFLVCIDFYHNETSRLADVILPGTSPFEDAHYDQFLGSMGHRNVARFSAPVVASDRPKEWDIGLVLGHMLAVGRVPGHEELSAYEDDVVAAFAAAHCSDEGSPIHGRDVQEIMAMVEPARGVERMLEIGIRAGQWGDAFGRREGLTLSKLMVSPNGIDFGAIRAGRLGEVNLRPDKKIDLAPDAVIEDLQRLPIEESVDGYLLVGRRNASTNNSWLRNVPMLGRGRALCVLEIHEKDAELLGVVDGDVVALSSDTATLQVPVRRTADIARGVVALPHGFSNSGNLQQQRLRQGENYNRLAAANRIDLPSATSALNGIPVSIERVV